MIVDLLFLFFLVTGDVVGDVVEWVEWVVVDLFWIIQSTTSLTITASSSRAKLLRDSL